MSPLQREITFNETQFKGCLRKIKHPTILSAMQHCSRIVKTSSTPVNFYHCAHCNGIHVGHFGKNDSNQVHYGSYTDNLKNLQGG